MPLTTTLRKTLRFFNIGTTCNPMTGATDSHARVFGNYPLPAKVWDLRLAEGLAGDRLSDHSPDRSTAPISGHPSSRPDSPPPPPPPTPPPPSDLPNDSQNPVFSTPAATAVATPSREPEAHQVGARANTQTRITYFPKR